MTREEIKQQYSMRDVLKRYGLIPNRSGFIRCPFHDGDNQASMKIYAQDYNCFGCGANGDIFSFVQQIENVSFAEAFQILGGTYGKPTFGSRLAIYRAQKQREMEQKASARLQKQKRDNQALISIFRRFLVRSAPLSDAWCESYNALQYQLHVHAMLNDIEER